jgi:hypothetical protein
LFNLSIDKNAEKKIHTRLIITEKKNKKEMRLLKSHPILRLANSYVVDAPAPINLSYL